MDDDLLVIKGSTDTISFKNPSLPLQTCPTFIFTLLLMSLIPFQRLWREWDLNPHFHDVMSPDDLLSRSLLDDHLLTDTIGHNGKLLVINNGHVNDLVNLLFRTGNPNRNHSFHEHLS